MVQHMEPEEHVGLHASAPVRAALKKVLAITGSASNLNSAPPTNALKTCFKACRRGIRVPTMREMSSNNSAITFLLLAY